MRPRPVPELKPRSRTRTASGPCRPPARATAPDRSRRRPGRMRAAQRLLLACRVQSNVPFSRIARHADHAKASMTSMTWLPRPGCPRRNSRIGRVRRRFECGQARSIISGPATSPPSPLRVSRWKAQYWTRKSMIVGLAEGDAVQFLVHAHNLLFLVQLDVQFPQCAAAAPPPGNCHPGR
jgi:hypothetical protein